MPERDGYIPGVPCWVDTSQPDPEAAVDFYSGLFGWAFEDVMPPGADGRYFIARLRGGDVAAVGSLPPSGPPMAMWNSYVWVEDADEVAAKVRAAGGTVLSEPFDVPGAGRMAVCADPEGAVFCLWQAGAHKGARIINEAGALVFNDLATRDRARAVSFYGSVFGWGTLGEGDGAAMWTLPGYGDHLALGDPELRQRHAEVGAPPGFEDVVASLNPIGVEDSDVPSHWNVTFATDDADATAERARSLGATLLAPPFDAPWVRMTVIADPQGATFVASQFVAANRDVPAPSHAPAGAA
jgi:predicted enzyme related to lactoylglutathione lyase